MLVASHDSGQQTGFASVVRIDGDALDGTYEATLTVPKGGAPGIWSISLYPLEDAAGNDSSGFGPGPDYVSDFTVEASPEADVDPPQLVSWSLTPTSIDASQSDASVVVTLRVTDNSSGASTPLLVASHDSGQQTGFASVVRIDGDALDGTYEATLTVPKGGAPGIWSISLYPLEDAAGNDSSGFGPGPDYVSDFTVEASPEADVDPPQLVSWSLTPTSIDASQSDASVVVTLRVTDNSSGASTPLLVASHDSGQQTGFASVVRIDGDALDGTYEATLTVPKGGAPGIWSISLYPLEDAAGNDSSGFGPGPDYVSDFQNEVIDSDDDGVRDLDDDFPSDPTETTDADADGVGDNADQFDDDPFEAFDTDGDGIGDNADLDDDNDGFSDEEELADGTDPLSRFSCRSGCFSFDVDESLEAQPLTDGLLVIRHLFGFSGDSLTSGAVSARRSRDSSDAIASYLTDADSQLDIDGDGESKPLTDGLLLIRYLFGFSGDSLISGAIGTDATRDTAEEVEAYIKERVPAE